MLNWLRRKRLSPDARKRLLLVAARAEEQRRPLVQLDRLHVQDPSTITVSGCVQCAGKNVGYPPFNDNDWTFNIGEPRWAVLDRVTKRHGFLESTL